MVAKSNTTQPKTLFNRKAIGDEIERRIAFLDAMDPDPDLEDTCEDEGAQVDDNDEEQDAYYAIIDIETNWIGETQ